MTHDEAVRCLNANDDAQPVSQREVAHTNCAFKAGGAFFAALDASQERGESSGRGGKRASRGCEVNRMKRISTTTGAAWLLDQAALLNLHSRELRERNNCANDTTC